MSGCWNAASQSASPSRCLKLLHCRQSRLLALDRTLCCSWHFPAQKLVYWTFCTSSSPQYDYGQEFCLVCASFITYVKFKKGRTRRICNSLPMVFWESGCAESGRNTGCLLSQPGNFGIWDLITSVTATFHCKLVDPKVFFTWTVKVDLPYPVSIALKKKKET